MANKLEIIEKAFIRFAAVNSSAAKQIARWEFESWLTEALTRVGRNVAASQNFRTLQKRFTTQLGYYDKSLTFDLQQSFSSAGGWRSGVTINADGSIQGAIDSFVFAADAVTMDIGEECHKSQYVEFAFQSESSQPVTLAFWPVSQPVNALKPGVEVAGQAEILLAVTVEQNASAPSTLSAWAGGNPVLNPDVTAPVSIGDRIRIYCNSVGQVIVQLYESTTSVIKGEYPLVSYNDATVPLQILQNFIPVLLFHELDAKVSNVRVGVIDPCLAAIDERVIVDSIRTRGSVRFEDGKPLAYVAGGHLAGLPRIKGQWHWTEEGRQVRVFSSPSQERIYNSPLDTPVYRYDRARRAWVSLTALPSGVSLPAGTITVNYDPSEVRLTAGVAYAVNTTKEAITLRLPSNAADGALVKLQDAGTSWEVNPVTLKASFGDVLLELGPTERRIVIEANAIPTIEEVPFELAETVINALLEIALERRGNPAMKQKVNQVPAKISETPPDSQPNQP